MLLQVAEILDASEHLSYRSVVCLLQVCSELHSVFMHRKASPHVLAFMRRLRSSVYTNNRLVGVYVCHGPTSFMAVGRDIKVNYVVTIQGKDKLRIQGFLLPYRYVIDLSAILFIDEPCHSRFQGRMDYWGQESGVACGCPFEVSELYPWRVLAYTWNIE